MWQVAHELTLALYKSTGTFPQAERYGLTSQIRRSASSVCANIAEGCCRQTRREFARFAYVALGSASELEYHLLLAFDLGILKNEQYEVLDGSVTRTKRMLSGLIRKLTTDNR
ncbi:MAG TPA: four helix bundle protein [Gammaproteobacteria bacterium]|nr:four helix bundle protein [Gammaproteobacteria bacterium]